MLKIINGKTLQISQNECLNRINELRKTGKVIVVCPDRMALQVENQIFDTLNVTSIFDCDVYTLTRLTQKVLNKLGNTKKILTKQLAVTIIKKILLENKFNSFKNVVNYNGFALKLFEIISMFKSSKVTPSMLLLNTKNEILKEKLTDLNVVYEKYEEFLQNDYTDSFNKLDLFANSVTNEFVDTHIVFVGFSDFTKQMLNIINMFLTKSKSVTIGTAASFGFKNLNNTNIFVNNIFYSLIEICKTNGHMYHIENVEQSLTPLKNHLLNNLYSYNGKKFEGENNELKIVSFANESTELDFVLKDIKYKLINKKLRYDDFAIICPNLKNRALELKTKFDEFSIPYFLDISSTLTETTLCKYINSIFECVLYGFKKDDFLNVLKNIYSNLNLDEISRFEIYLKENGIEKISINDIINFENVKLIYEHILNLNIVNNLTITEYISLIFDLFKNLDIEQTTLNIIKNLEGNSKIELAKSYKISYEKMVSALQEIDNLLNVYETPFINFYKILKIYLENVTITIPPLIGDVVMVYDTNNSFIDNNNYVYMISCVEGIVPQVTNDVSLVSDKEINLFNNELRLSPTVEQINKRSKFKVFENVFKFNEKLTITYFNRGSSGNYIASSFVSSLIKVLNLEVINGDKYISNYNYFEDVENKYIFELNNVNESSAYGNFINLTKNFESNFGVQNFNKYYFSLLSALPNVDFRQTILNNNNFNNNVTNLTSTDIYFPNKNTSVSQIETYYLCPYKHFIRYGLNLTEVKNGSLMPNDIGSIIHDFNSEIIVSFKNVLTDEQIYNLTNKTLKNIIEKKYSHFLKNSKNKNIIKNLYSECYRIASAIYKQQQDSKYKNAYNEKRFNNLEELSVTVDGYKIFVKGFIDRIDFYDDKFMVIDYKTGKDVFNFTDLVAGKKIQLLVYVKAVNSMYNKIPVCTCYMPIKNEFNKNDINPYKFKGLFVNSLSELQNIDKNILVPQLSNIGIKTKKDGDFDEYSKPFCISEEQMLKLADFAFDLLKQAVEQILKGNIQPMPLLIGKTSACENCSYKGICNFSRVYKNKYRIQEKVSNINDILK